MCWSLLLGFCSVCGALLLGWWLLSGRRLGARGRLDFWLLARWSDIHLIIDIFELGRTCIVCHEVCGYVATGGTGCGAHWAGTCHDRFRSSVVSVDCFSTSGVRVIAPAEGVLALRLHIEKIAGALLSWGVLVGHTRLHHFLQAFALSCKLVHYIILHLKRIL